jgi:hypothetical protein
MTTMDLRAGGLDTSKSAGRLIAMEASRCPEPREDIKSLIYIPASPESA